jgi:hypothetical protein
VKLEEVVLFNKDRPQARANTTLFNLSLTFIALAVLSALIPEIKVPYLGASGGGIDEILGQFTLFLMLVNTDQVYSTYVQKVEISESCRWTCLLVYAAHLVAALAIFKWPEQWLTPIAALVLLILVVDIELWLTFKAQPEHPLHGLFGKWVRDASIYLVLLTLYSIAVIALSSVSFYARFDTLGRSKEVLDTAAIFIRHIHTGLLLIGAVGISIPTLFEIRAKSWFSRSLDQRTTEILRDFYIRRDG